jgi:hypothetical protein
MEKCKPSWGKQDYFMLSGALFLFVMLFEGHPEPDQMAHAGYAYLLPNAWCELVPSFSKEEVTIVSTSMRLSPVRLAGLLQPLDPTVITPESRFPSL